MKGLFLAALVQTIAGCSSFSDSAPVSQIWSVSQDLGESYLLSFSGAFDVNHFYAVRSRTNSSSRVLAAYNRADGRIAWTGTTTAVEALVAAEGRVFSPGDILNAYDAGSGRSLWTFRPDSTLQLVRGTADGSRVFVGSLSSVYAVDAATGALLWKRSFSGPWRSTRLRTLVLSAENTLLVTFDAEFVVGGVSKAAVVQAVDPATGTELWRYVDGDETTNKSPRGLTTYGDLAIYSDGGAAEVVAFSRSTRQVVWRAPWTPGYISTQRAPLVADGVAYFTDGGGAAFAVDAATGVRRWASQPSASGFFSHEICGPLLLGNNGPTQIIDRATGQSRGRLFPDGETTLMMATDGDQAFVSTTKGVYAFDCSP